MIFEKKFYDHDGIRVAKTVDGILDGAPLLARQDPGEGEQQKLECLEVLHGERQDTWMRAGFVDR